MFPIIQSMVAKRGFTDQQLAAIGHRFIAKENKKLKNTDALRPETEDFICWPYRHNEINLSVWSLFFILITHG